MDLYGHANSSQRELRLRPCGQRQRLNGGLIPNQDAVKRKHLLENIMNIEGTANKVDVSHTVDIKLQ